MNSIQQSDNKYKEAIDFLFFHNNFLTYKIKNNEYSNIMRICNTCKTPMTDEYLYENINGTLMVTCIDCNININRVNKLYDIRKYYGLILLYSRELLKNYILNGYDLPEISMLIVNNIINIELAKYKKKSYNPVSYIGWL